LECLQHHTLSSMLFDGIFEAHCAWILSCYGPRAGAWLIIRPIFRTFWLFSPFFSTTLRMWFGLPHPSIASIFRCVCTHPINPMGIHFLCCAHGNECIGTHGAICDTFVAIAWDVACGMRTITNVSFNFIQLFLLTNRNCAHQRWHSHFSQCYHCRPNVSGFIFSILCNSRICCLRCSSS
jgi:hypothetical protein